MKQEYYITPIAKPRMTRRDQFVKRTATDKYWKFKDYCKAARIILPCYKTHVTFVLPMPASWPMKKKTKMEGQPHMCKPDLDNLLKGLGDAIYEDDSGIYDIRVSKRWGFEGKIIIEEMEDAVLH